MSNLFKKVALSFLSAWVILFSFAPHLQVLAQDAPAEGTWYNQDFKGWYSKVYDESVSPGNEIFGERYTAAQVQWVVYSLMSLIINGSMGNSSQSQKLVSCFLTSVGNVESCASALKDLISDTGSSSLRIANTSEANQKSLLQMVFSDRPLSGVSYTKEKLANFRIVPEAKAQSTGVGFGFDALAPVQGMWKGVRDVSYGLFVLAAVVLSFMIMFRVKISPQVVISVQSALPKLFTALILTTFSYAIAGFLIDLMYVVIGLISLMAPSFLSFNTPSVDAKEIFEFLTSTMILGSMAKYIVFFCIAFIGMIIANIGALAFATAVGITAGLAASTGGLLIILGVLIIIILLLVIIWNAFKTIWALIKAFASVLLLTIFAPLQITAGIVIPNFGFSQWLKSYVGALSTFVVTGILLLFSFVFLYNGVKLGLDAFFGDGSFGNAIISFLFGVAVPNAISTLSSTGSASGAWPPLLGMGSGNMGVGLIYLGVSFVLFTLIPKATEVVNGLMTGKPFAYGTAIGEAFGGVGWAYGASGMKDNVDMVKRAYRQGQLETFFSPDNYRNNKGLLARTINQAESLPYIGPQVTKIRKNVQSGFEPRHK